MKKIILLLAVLFSFSCSKDDEATTEQTQHECSMKVYTLGTGSGIDTQVYYNITYGASDNSESQVTTYVTQDVYNYYYQKTQEAHPNKAIWKGEISE